MRKAGDRCVTFCSEFVVVRLDIVHPLLRHRPVAQGRAPIRFEQKYREVLCHLGHFLD